MLEDKSSFVDYLKQIYGEANTHLLEQDHKRDQIVTFYAVLVSFFITTQGAIMKSLGGGHLMILFLSAGIMFIGVVVSLTIGDLRNWHRQYLDSIYVINFAVSHQHNYETVSDLIDAIYEKLTQNQFKSTKTIKKPWYVKLSKLFFGSTDNDVYTGILIFTSLSIFLFFKNLNVSQYRIWALVVSVIYIIVMERHLQKQLNKGNTYKTWILDFDYYSNGSNPHKYYEVHQHDGIVSLKQNTAGVVTIPIYNQRFLLIYVGRNDGQKHWEFPRGFVEKDEIQNDIIRYDLAAKRELNEELNLYDFDKIQDLGAIMPDSGLINGHINIERVILNSIDHIKLQDSEKIVKYNLFTMNELQKMISNNDIIDGFTLSSLAKISSIN